LVIPYYVMTRDIKRSPVPGQVTATMPGLRTRAAKFAGYDPVPDRPVAVRVLRTKNSGRR